MRDFILQFRGRAVRVRYAYAVLPPGDQTDAPIEEQGTLEGMTDHGVTLREPGLPTRTLYIPWPSIAAILTAEEPSP